MVSCRVSLVSFNLEQLLSLPLSFRAVTVLKNPGEVLCRMLHKSGLPEVP